MYRLLGKEYTIGTGFWEVKLTTFFHIGIIFVPVIMESDKVAIVFINPGSGNHGSSEITPDIVYHGFGITFVWLCIDIETVLVFPVTALKDGTDSLLEMESGSNDPIAYLLVMIGIQIVSGAAGKPVCYLLFSGIVYGAVIGVAMAVLGIFILKPFKVSSQKWLLVSWAGLRGAASIVFAIIVVAEGVDLSMDLFHIVFFISLISVALQGGFLPKIAHKRDMIDYREDVRKPFNDYQEESQNIRTGSSCQNVTILVQLLPIFRRSLI